MSKILVIGASGGMGSAIVNELVERETFEVVAFARRRQKLETLFGSESKVTIVAGDVFNPEQLRMAARGTEIIFHAMNVPYSEWEMKLPLILTNVLSVAKEANAKLVYVDNIYSYGRSNGEKVSEEYFKHPHTKKGKIRLRLENTIKASNVEYLIAHFPDFYGPYAENTLLHQTFHNVTRNKKALFIGRPEIPREYIYTPDGARALVELSLRDNFYQQNWNIPGAGVITGNEILKILRSYGYSKGLTVLTKLVFRILGLFNSDMKEIVEMFYLNEQPVVLCGGKMEKELGTVSRTPYEKGILATLEALKVSNV